MSLRTLCLLNLAVAQATAASELLNSASLQLRGHDNGRRRWPLVPLGEVLHLHIDAVPVDPSKSYPMAGVYSFGRGLLTRDALSGSNTTYRFLHRLHAGDFVISVPKAWEGALARIPEDCDGRFLSPVFPTFRANAERLDTRFLMWCCRQASVWEMLKGKSRGIGARRESVSPEQFLTLTIALPPLPEQQRIVARIEELAAKIEEAKGTREAAQQAGETVPVSARNELFSSIAASTAAVRLDSIAETRLGKMLSRNQSTDPQAVPYLRNANIQWDRLDLRDVFRMTVSDEDRKTLALRSGDILVCEGGDIGKAAVWNNEMPGCIYQKALHRVRVNSDRLVPRFLLHQIFWAAEQGQFAEVKTQTTIAHLTGVKLKAHPVCAPSLSDQRRIVVYLDSLQAKVDELKKLQAETQAELDALLPSILDKAFKGEL